MSTTPPVDPPRILLVTHEASRSGAPRVAALVLRSLVEKGYPTTVVSLSDGPLVSEFRALARTTVEPFWRLRNRLSRRPLLRPLGRALDGVVALILLALHPSDLVYLNSTAAAAYLRPARWLRRRVILHAHESFDIASMFLDRAKAGSLADVELIACSPSVHTDLQRLASRSAADVHLIPSVPDDRAAAASRTARDDQAPAALAESQHAPDPRTQVVGACGAVGRRKGTDLWLDIARRVRATAPDLDARFVWVGDYSEIPQNIPPNVVFTGPTSDAFSAIAGFDVAVLTSRDDPFPLVVLEAMLMGIPVVAFDVGGVRDQIGDAGILVPPEDVDAFAGALITLLTDATRRRSLGEAARKRALTLYSTTAFSDQLLTVVDGQHHQAAR